MRRLPGTHPANIKNRSSKHLGWLCGPGHKPYVRKISTAALQEILKEGNEPKGKTSFYYEAQRELTRRRKKSEPKNAS